MSFISKVEFSGSIRTTVIDVLTNNQDSIVTQTVDQTVELMKSYLRGKYSGETLFDATGTSRNTLLMKYCRDIAIYDLYSIYNFRKMPEQRVKRYEEARQWLQDVQAEKVNPFLYGSGTTGYTIMVKAGSINDIRDNYQT